MRRSGSCRRCFTFCSLGTSIFRAFLIIGCGFSSSSEKRCRRGSKASWPGTLDSARSAGSGSKFTMMSLLPLAPAVGPGGQVEEGEGSWGTAWPPERERERERRTLNVRLKMTKPSKINCSFWTATDRFVLEISAGFLFLSIHFFSH